MSSIEQPHEEKRRSLPSPASQPGSPGTAQEFPARALAVTQGTWPCDKQLSQDHATQPGSPGIATRPGSPKSTPEFAEGASMPPDGPTRRRFLQLMAASAGLAGLTACRWPKESILPYARRPLEITPGVPLQFATSMEIAGMAQGLVITSFDGRPIKVDGNPLHPINQGSCDVFAQASVLDLYDPDRSRNPIQAERGGSTPTYFDRNWNEFDEFARTHFAQLRRQQGRGLYVLSEASSSPSVADMREHFLKTCPQATWYEYEPTLSDNERDGSRLATDGYYRTHYALDKVKVIISLDSDFVMRHPASLKLARDFTKAHTPTSDNNYTMSRLYVVEPTYTNTGAMADSRLAVPARDVWPIACRLAVTLAQGGLATRALDEETVKALRSQAAAGNPADAFVQAMAKDLLEFRGQSAILVGPGQPDYLHALGHALNAALGNIGNTVTYSAEAASLFVRGQESLLRLLPEAAGGQVQTLLILGGNPVYTAPASPDLGASLAKIPTTIHLSDYWNETSRLCTWHVPRAHYLEAWGDVRSFDGTYSVAQPLIAPLYDGRSIIEILGQISEDKPLTGYEVVRRTVRQQFADGLTDEVFEDSWRKLLNDGLLPGSQYPLVQPAVRQVALQQRLAHVARPQAALSAGNLEIVFREDARVFDGRFVNNAWLQETPDTLTKITWDNAMLVSPATAAALKIRNEQVVRLSTGKQRTIDAPVYVMPGQPDWSVTVYLGYGRKAAGRVGTGVGFDAYALRASAATNFVDAATITPTGRTHTFAMTQYHYDTDTIGRRGEHARVEEIATDTTLTEWRRDSRLAEEGHAPAELWQPVEYPGHRWGMAIDMQKCIGCNACVVACQAENNVPVVGKEQVQRRRHMQWLRIDRYFRGEPAAPFVTFQPMFCVHCENAPCEAVCPVAATLHDSDGLNLMVYNRCVGTRYCSNNCPYKVRRFNFYHWNKDITSLEAMVKNPDVTVRSRGVMEKCTYCIQRIERAKITAKNERRTLREGEVVTACQQACPTGAIVFGDLRNPDSAVSKLHQQSRSYAVLMELNTRPRSLHMMRVRNPSPVLEEHNSNNGNHRRGAEDAEKI